MRGRFDRTQVQLFWLNISMTPEELVGFSFYRSFPANVIAHIDDFISSSTSGLVDHGDSEDWFQCIIQLASTCERYGITDYVYKPEPEPNVAPLTNQDVPFCDLTLTYVF